MIKILIRILLLACFFWPACLLIISIAFGILVFNVDFENGYVSLIFFGLSVLGIAGLYGVAQVNLKLCKPQLMVEKPWVIITCLGSGVVGMTLAYILIPFEGIYHALYLSPILATGLYLYMLKGYLFGGAS